MGIGIRIFLVGDDDSITRFPLTRFERLIHRDPEGRLSQYAGKRVRFVEVALELNQRKPVGILRTQPFVISLDSEGFADQTEQEKEKRLIVEMISSPLIRREPGSLIEAGHHFAKKRFDHRYKWAPTPEIEMAILEAVFGKDLNE